MNFKLPALICFLLIFQGSYTAGVQNSRMLSTNYVTKSGSVPIQKDSYGYYVNADLLYNYYDASDSEDFDSYLGQFQLGLYTSFTLFSTYCQSFNNYPCSTYSCSQYTWTSSTPSFPDFSVTTGYPMTANLYLDYGNWQLGQGNAVSAYQCSSYNGYAEGYDRYGIIGLGFNYSLNSYVSGVSNYLNSTTFSISLERDGSSGTLLFWSNEDITSSSSYVGQLSATEDLLVTPSSMTIAVGSTSLTTTVGLMFDLNSPKGIGLPYSIYYDIIENLESIASTSCDSSSYSSYCSYTGQVSDLPTITFTIQGVSIQIPPTVYVQDATDDDTYVSGIILNFRLVDPSYSNYMYNYVTPAFSNYIILDSSVMSYYYTEFAYNYGSPTITIYNPSSSPSSDVIWPYIVGGVVGGIVIVIIICCCCARRRRNRLSQQAKIVVSDGVNTSDQVPFVTNVQVNNLPYPAQNYPAAQNQAYPPQTFPNYGQANYGFPQYSNQGNVAAYGGYGQPGNYMPPQQGQFYGNGQGQGYTGVPPAQNEQGYLQPAKTQFGGQ